VLKADVEGPELRLIENYGDLLGRVRAAVFELHHDFCDAERRRARRPRDETVLRSPRRRRSDPLRARRCTAASELLWGNNNNLFD